MKAFPYSQDDVNNALTSDATAVRILQKSKTPSKGMLVGVRLNLNVLKKYWCPSANDSCCYQPSRLSKEPGRL